MAVTRIQQEGLYLVWEPPIEELAKRLKSFGPTISAKYLGAALRKASEPAEKALKANVAKLGKVTGNLRRAVKSKTKRYTRTGNAVVLVGFEAVPGKKVPPGGDEKSAFHGGLIEFGTGDRKAKGSIASSFRANNTRRAGFKIVQPRYKKGRSRRMGIDPVTKPKYPRAFFARAINGTAVELGKTRAYAPIRRAWEQSRSQCQSLLTDAMYDAIENARKDLFAP
jgi:HK97 gp10 family phage protein